MGNLLGMARDALELLRELPRIRVLLEQLLKERNDA